MKQPSLALSFAALQHGQIGISPTYGSFLSEAASHCLHHNHHANPALLQLTGEICTPSNLSWCDPNDANERTWADLQEATEYGAYGVAIIVALSLTEAKGVERSAKGTGIDYWLGDSKDPRGIFQRTARLEVSGVLNGDQTKIAARLNQKMVQTKQSDAAETPAYVVIVEFGSPEARFVRSTAETKS